MAKKDEKMLEDMRKRFDLAVRVEKTNRTNFKSDIEFVFQSKQWPEEVKSKRIKKARPCLTINKLKKFVKNISGEMRQALPTIKFRPVDSIGDPIIANIYEDIKRTIDADPEAQMAYKAAFEHAVAGGFGFYRLTTEYEEDGFNQVIKRKRVANPLRVYLDPTALDYLYRDGQYGFIVEPMSRELFESKYPKIDTTDFNTIDRTLFENWVYESTVLVAEYFYKVPSTVDIVQTEDGSIYELTQGINRSNIEMLIGQRVTKERTVKSYKVMWCKTNGTEILEGPTEWPGKFIPIIPVLGDEESIDGHRNFYSLIREAKDPQMAYNFWRSHAAETIALAPKAPYKLTKQQIEGMEKYWDEANIENFPYLVYNHVPNVPPPQRERPPDIPAAAIGEANSATFDIMDSMGQYQANLGQQGNERSGKAILARKREGDATVYSFLDNLYMSIVFEGQMIAELIPKVYDTERVLRIQGPEGQANFIEINKVIIDPATLERIVINDTTVGKYDVVPDVGPSYATKREEIAAALGEVLQYAPMTAPAVVPRLAKVLDIPDGEQMAQEIAMIMNPMMGQQSPTGEMGALPPQLAGMAPPPAV